MDGRYGTWNIRIHHSVELLPLGRPKHRWRGNIKECLKEMGWDDVEGIHVAQDRHIWRTFVNMFVNLRNL